VRREALQRKSKGPDDEDAGPLKERGKKWGIGRLLAAREIKPPTHVTVKRGVRVGAGGEKKQKNLIWGSAR